MGAAGGRAGEHRAARGTSRLLLQRVREALCVLFFSCFFSSLFASLAGILSQIVQSIYALRPAASRHAELVVLDGQLEKWHLALPAHLQHDPARSTRGGGAGEVPLPQVLTLHMQYWCAVLLLHRPLSVPFRSFRCRRC